LRLAGAELVPAAVDASGFSIEALEKILRTRNVRAVYVTPHHQYPTTVMLPAARRLALLDLAKRHRFAIIEDDYDHEFHYVHTARRFVFSGTMQPVNALRLGFAPLDPPKLREAVVRLRDSLRP
jgi:GntR family transcriptional regulator/MocR family aminotransferase